MEENFEQSIPLEYVIFGFVTLSALSYLLQAKLRKRHLAREGQIFNSDGSIPSIEKRLSANKQWSSGKIKSHGSLLFLAIWLMAIAWNLTFGLAFYKSFSNPEIKLPALIMLGIISLGGPVAIYFAIRETIRRFKYGNTYCSINGKAGVLGKVMEGRIFPSTKIKAEGDFEIALECIEIYYQGTGKQRTSKTIIHWQSRKNITFKSENTNIGIPFVFDLPKSAPETGYQLSLGDINWHLRISAVTEGIDYYAVFIVPVFKME